MQTEPSPRPASPRSAQASSDVESDDAVWPSTAALPPLAVLLRDGFRWFTDRLNATAVEDGQPAISAAAGLVVSYLRPEGSRPADIARAMGVSRQHVHTVFRELTDVGSLTDLHGIGDVVAAKIRPGPARSAGSGRRLRSPRIAVSRR